LTKLVGGKSTYFGTAFQTDDGAGPVSPYSGTAAAPPANGIPPAQ
jgi:branched-chain amino acid transport system substrate-binding protein